MDICEHRSTPFFDEHSLRSSPKFNKFVEYNNLSGHKRSKCSLKCSLKSIKNKRRVGASENNNNNPIFYRQISNEDKHEYTKYDEKYSNSKNMTKEYQSSNSCINNEKTIINRSSTHPYSNNNRLRIINHGCFKDQKYQKSRVTLKPKKIIFDDIKMGVRVNSLMRKMCVHNFSDYFPHNDVLQKYLILRDIFIDGISITIMGYLFDKDEMMIMNDFRFLSFTIRDSPTQINEYMLESLKHNNEIFANNIYKQFLNNDKLIDFMCDNVKHIVWSCNIHTKSHRWIKTKLENIINNGSLETCGRLLEFINTFADKDIYTITMKKYPSLIEEQLKLPGIKRTVDSLLMAINANILQINIVDNSFQLLPYSEGNNIDEPEPEPEQENIDGNINNMPEDQIDANAAI
jgi:hypothetical protein